MVICSLSMYERLCINFIPTPLGHYVLPISINKCTKCMNSTELQNVDHVRFCTLLLYFITTIHRTIPFRLLCLLRFLVMPPVYISQKLWYDSQLCPLFTLPRSCGAIPSYAPCLHQLEAVVRFLVMPAVYISQKLWYDSQ